ncbi:PAS domain S-box protein, partial [bacterium]|nr:PAS domain S-box protein [bacterium]
MFNLTRHYSMASLVCIIVAAAILGMVYRKLSVESLMRMAEDRNAALTHVFGNALGHRLTPLLTMGVGGIAPDPDGDEVAAMRQKVVSLMRDTSVVKVKIYTLQGLTVFSTEKKQIGEDKRTNPGIHAAAQGELASELTHRNQFSAFDGVIESRDVLSSYIPFIPPGSTRIEGVVEVYSDITPFLAEVKQTQWRVVATVAGVLSVLYGLLFGIVRRADRIIKAQGAELTRTLARIEEDNQLLDQRVSERTRELEGVNRALQEEIAERELAEEKLRLSAKVFDNTVEGVIITDAETTILAVNRAFSQVTGYQEEEIIGLTPQILKSGRHEAPFYAEMWNSLKQKGKWVGEIWNKRKSGEIYPKWTRINVVK